MELFEPFREEAPRPPELFEILLPLSVERIHLARRPLLGRILLHIDEASLLDPDEQRVDGALGDIGETLFPQPRRDLVAVRGCPDRIARTMPSSVPLSISVICLPTEHLLELLSITSY